jgi:hypothetical protein
VAAADVGHARPALQLVDHAVEGGEPLLHQVRVVHRAEEPLAAVVDVLVVLVPPDAGLVACRVDDAVDVVGRAEGDLEEAGQVRRAARVGEGRGMLRREGVGAGRLVVLDVAAGRLGVEPLAGVVLVGGGAAGEPAGRHRRAVGHRGVVAQLVAEDDERGVEGGADLVDGLEDEGHQLVGVEGRGLVDCGHGVLLVVVAWLVARR